MIFYIFIALAVLLAVFLVFWQFWFLRNPKRTPPAGRNIVSPADGRVIEIIEFNKNKLTVRKGLGKVRTLTSDVVSSGYLISIFMSPLDVHFQRAPIDGVVLKTRHSKGSFNVAYDFFKSMTNEKNEILMKTKIGRIKIIQIAGILARRIVCFAKKNQKIKKGQTIGLINLGSQVCLVIPKLKLKIKKGDKAVAGRTIIAEYK